MWATFRWSNGVLDSRHCPLSRNQSVRAVHLANLWQNLYNQKSVYPNIDIDLKMMLENVFVILGKLRIHGIYIEFSFRICIIFISNTSFTLAHDF